MLGAGMAVVPEEEDAAPPPAPASAAAVAGAEEAEAEVEAEEVEANAELLEYKGKKFPLITVFPNWSSAIVAAIMADIIAREHLGIKHFFRPTGGSFGNAELVSGCLFDVGTP